MEATEVASYGVVHDKVYEIVRAAPSSFVNFVVHYLDLDYVVNFVVNYIAGRSRGRMP